MKLWILHRNEISYTKLIAEYLQDYLDNDFDVFVGNVDKIDPNFLIEDDLDFLIIGDITGEIIPSIEIQNWLVNFSKTMKNHNFQIKNLSVYCIGLTDLNIESLWIEFLQKKLNINNIFPPLLHLKLNESNLSLEGNAIELIRKYTNIFTNNFID